MATPDFAGFLNPANVKAADEHLFANVHRIAQASMQFSQLRGARMPVPMPPREPSRRSSMCSDTEFDGEGALPLPFAAATHAPQSAVGFSTLMSLSHQKAAHARLQATIQADIDALTSKMGASSFGRASPSESSSSLMKLSAASTLSSSRPRATSSDSASGKLTSFSSSVRLGGHFSAGLYAHTITPHGALSAVPELSSFGLASLHPRPSSSRGAAAASAAAAFFQPLTGSSAPQPGIASGHNRNAGAPLLSSLTSFAGSSHHPSSSQWPALHSASRVSAVQVEVALFPPSISTQQLTAPTVQVEVERVQVQLGTSSALAGDRALASLTSSSARFSLTSQQQQAQTSIYAQQAEQEHGQQRLPHIAFSSAQGAQLQPWRGAGAQDERSLRRSTHAEFTDEESLLQPHLAVSSSSTGHDYADAGDSAGHSVTGGHRAPAGGHGQATSSGAVSTIGGGSSSGSGTTPVTRDTHHHASSVDPHASVDDVIELDQGDGDQDEVEVDDDGSSRSGAAEEDEEVEVDDGAAEEVELDSVDAQSEIDLTADTTDDEVEVARPAAETAAASDEIDLTADSDDDAVPAAAAAAPSDEIDMTGDTDDDEPVPAVTLETPMMRMARAVAAAAQARRDAGVPILSDDLHEMRTAPLNEAEENVVYDAVYNMRPDESEQLISSSHQTLTRRDLRVLQSKMWLMDEVMNFYLELISERWKRLLAANAAEIERCNRLGIPPPKALRGIKVFNTFFYAKLIGDAYENGLIVEKGYNYENVRRWTLRHGLLNIFELEVIIVPLNFNNVHWALAAIFPQRRRIMVLDSLGGDKERVFDVLKRYVKDEFNNKQPKGYDLRIDDWRLERSQRTVPQQTNGFDCGVFTCMFAGEWGAFDDGFTRMIADYVVGGRFPDFSQKNIAIFRKRIALACLSKHLD